MLHRRAITARDYGEWSMGFQQVSDADLGQIEGLTNFDVDDFTFDYLAGHEAVVDRLLEHYREPHWDQVIGEFDAKDKTIKHLEAALHSVRDQVRIARLALDSITEAARNGEPIDSVLKICDATLASMKTSAHKTDEPGAES